MVKELKEFINDWQVNSAKNEAVHNTGLGFKCNNRGIKGDNDVEIGNLPKWYPAQKALGLSNSQIDEKLENLQEEFAVIYEKIIVPERAKIQTTLKSSRGSYE